MLEFRAFPVYFGCLEKGCSRQGARLQYLPWRPHLKHVWDFRSHILSQTNNYSSNSGDNARSNPKGGTASLRSRACIKRNAAFGARFEGLSLYFLYQKGNLIRIKTGLHTYLIRIQICTPPSRYPPYDCSKMQQFFDLCELSRPMNYCATTIVGTRRIGANPEKSDLVNFRARTEENLVNSVFSCFFLGKTDKMLPKSRFSKPIFGRSAGSPKLDRPYCKRF